MGNYTYFRFFGRKSTKGLSINDVTHLREGGSAKRRLCSISLFSAMVDKEEGGVKNLKMWGTSFMVSPKSFSERSMKYVLKYYK